MPQTVKRDVSRQLRLTKGEDAKLTEDARAAGLTFSEYVRRQCGIGNFGRSALMGRRQLPSQKPVDLEPAPDHIERVRKMAARMPKRAAENVVRREEARERAKGALG